jgi:hypothetical protein
MYYLTTIEFEDGCNNILFGEGAFRDTTQITTVKVNSLNDWLSFTFVDVLSNPISNLKAELNIQGENLTECVIPNHIFSISSYAFFKYKSLNSFTIHKNVQSIGIAAFSGTPNLEQI